MTAAHGRETESATRWSAADVGQAPGIVKVRLSGAAADIEHITRLLAGTIIERSAPYPNRRNPGVRVYLTALVPGVGTVGQPAPGEVAGG
jgi:hypothetical protein